MKSKQKSVEMIKFIAKETNNKMQIKVCFCFFFHFWMATSVGLCIIDKISFELYTETETGFPEEKERVNIIFDFIFYPCLESS